VQHSKESGQKRGKGTRRGRRNGQQLLAQGVMIMVVVVVVVIPGAAAATYALLLPLQFRCCEASSCNTPAGTAYGGVSYTWTCPPQLEWHCPPGESRRHEAG